MTAPIFFTLSKFKKKVEKKVKMIYNIVKLFLDRNIRIIIADLIFGSIKA